MSLLSEITRERVKKDLLWALKSNQEPVTARYLAKQIGRDKEFLAVLLDELLIDGKVNLIEESRYTGKKYVKWRFWRYPLLLR